jgi:hypothetical protein
MLSILLNHAHVRGDSATIAGCPALHVRALLRRLRQDFWTVKEVARLLKVSEGQARRLVYALRVLGYVEVVREQRAGTWRMAGNALANASAPRPISRAEASRQLDEFLARVALVNADDSFPHRVGKVVIFGSYLSNQERIGDIDLAIPARPPPAVCRAMGLDRTSPGGGRRTPRSPLPRIH